MRQIARLTAVAMGSITLSLATWITSSSAVVSAHGSSLPGMRKVAVDSAASARRHGTPSGLTVTFAAHPTHAATRSPVKFTLSITDDHAVGAFGYLVKFGDGTTRTIAVPQYCLALPGRPEHVTWRFSHRYQRSGDVRASVVAYMNCSDARDTKVISLVIT
jgi:hypothetical protein